MIQYLAVKVVKTVIINCDSTLDSLASLKYFSFPNHSSPMNPASLKHALLRPCLAFFALTATATSQAASIMVNEYRNANGSVVNKMDNGEFIEFVVTESLTAAQLANMRFGNSNATTSLINSVFRFNQTSLQSILTAAGKTVFLPGTFIVVKGFGTANTSYNPLISNITNDDAWGIELVMGTSPSGAVFDDPTGIVNGDLSVDQHGDVIWISSAAPTSATDTSNFIHAIGHDGSPGAIANFANTQYGTLVSSTVGQPKSVLNIGNDTEVMDNFSTVSGPGAAFGMSLGNSTANTTWIQGLRGTPEPSRAMFLMLGLVSFLTRRQRRH
jgi:hypothetical protein